MEPRALVSLRIAAKPVLSRAELSEVLCSLWQLVCKQFDLDSTKRLCIEINVHEYNRVLWVQEVVLVS